MEIYKVLRVYNLYSYLVANFSTNVFKFTYTVLNTVILRCAFYKSKLPPTHRFILATILILW